MIQSKLSRELRVKSASVIFGLVSLGLLIVLLIGTIYREVLVLSALFSGGGVLIISAIIRTKIIVFTDFELSVYNFWTKKLLWSTKYNEINKVKVSFFSDTFYRSKKIEIIYNSGIKKKLVVVHVLMESLSDKFIKNQVPIWIKNNEKFTPYIKR